MAEEAAPRDYSRSTTWLCLGGAGLALVVDAVYVGLLFAAPSALVSPRGAVIASFMAVSALAAGGSIVVHRHRTRAVILGFAAVGLGATGLIGIFTVGLPLLLAAVSVGIATLLNLVSQPNLRLLERSLAGGGVAVAVLIAGLYFTELPVSCGSMTSGQGGGGTWWHGDYSYACEGGRLILKTSR